MSKLKMKQISGLNRRILGQMIPGRGGIETLNELRNRGTVRVWQRIIFQQDAQGIRASGLLTGSSLAKLDGGPFRCRRRGSGRQIPRDLVNLRWREAFLFLPFAAAQEQHQEETTSDQRQAP